MHVAFAKKIYFSAMSVVTENIAVSANACILGQVLEKVTANFYIFFCMIDNPSVC